MMKDGKLRGIYKIPNEVLKYGGKELKDNG